MVKVGDDMTVVELRGMSRPFPALKSLDMENVVEQVVDALLLMMKSEQQQSS